MKKILYAAAECAPFIKTGGLGAVVGSLPKELKKKGYDVRIVLPAYQCIDERWQKQMKSSLPFPVHLGWRNQPVTMKTLEYQGIICYFLSNDEYFCGDAPYGDMGMDVEKFSFFSKAVLEMLAFLEFEPEIIHCHDWQTALIPVFLKAFYGENPFYRKIKTIITLHNMRFQGCVDLDYLKEVTGLPDEYFTYDKLEFYGAGNMLKGGIAFADKITTVSKSYALEIQEEEYGESLDPLLRYRKEDLLGIVNGIDYQVYSPAQDEYIKYHYHAQDFYKAKRKNKVCLQKRTGMPVGKTIFTACIISRLTEQKGLDIFIPVLDEFLQQDVQLYILGSGEARYEEIFSCMARRYPQKVFLETVYTDALAKYMYAGCDATIMPSLFEPCGLSQLMALRYGTVPLVRRTGGLKDTVELYQEKYHTGTGFGFDDYSEEALKKTLDRMLLVYQNQPAEWNGIVKRGMEQDFSWVTSAGEYIKLYEQMDG